MVNGNEKQCWKTQGNVLNRCRIRQVLVYSHFLFAGTYVPEHELRFKASPDKLMNGNNFVGAVVYMKIKTSLLS